MFENLWKLYLPGGTKDKTLRYSAHYRNRKNTRLDTQVPQTACFYLSLHICPPGCVKSRRLTEGRMFLLEHFQKLGFVGTDAKIYLHGSPSLMLKSATLAFPTWSNHQAVFIPDFPSVWRFATWLSVSLVGTIAGSPHRVGKPHHCGCVQDGFSLVAFLFLPSVAACMCLSFHI